MASAPCTTCHVRRAAEALLKAFGGNTPDWLRDQAESLEDAIDASEHVPSFNERVRALNDAFRISFVGGTVLLSVGMEILPVATRREVLRLVREHRDFDPHTDLHREHDFGIVRFAGQYFVFKIDCYDPTYETVSSDPTDMQLTRRVLTVMRFSEC